MMKLCTLIVTYYLVDIKALLASAISPEALLRADMRGEAQVVGYAHGV